MPLFNITYEVTTDESAEHGDAEETGFRGQDITLRDAWNILRWEGYAEANDSCTATASWLTFYGDRDMHDGSFTNLSLHFPDTLTRSTRARIARLFGCK